MKTDIAEKGIVTRDAINEAVIYDKYYTLNKDLLQEGKTTGNNQNVSNAKICQAEFSKIEASYQTAIIGDDLLKALEFISKHQTWVVLTK